MKKIMLLLGFLVTTAALAGDAVIWNGSYGKFLPQLGLKLSDSKEYRTIAVDPSAGAGTVAQIGSVAVRDNAGVGEAWFKSGAGDTVWTNILTALTGWTILGNTGTNDAVNFIGTTDAQDLAVRTNNVERMRISDVGRFDFAVGADGMLVDGNVAAVVGDFNQLYMGTNMTSTISNNYYGPYLQPQFSGAVTGSFYGFTDVSSWDATSTVPTYNGVVVSPNFQPGSTVTSNISAFQFNPNIPAAALVGANVNGVYVTPVIASNFLGYSGFTDQPSISGAMTNGYNSFSSTPQFSATSSMPSNYKGFQSQPSIATGATFTSGVGFFSGANVASGVTINDWTDFQMSTDIDSPISSYTGVQVNPQGSGNVTNVTLLNVGANMSGDNSNVNGVNVTGNIGDDITNYGGINVSPAATGVVTNVTGISVNNSSLNSPNQKQGLNISDGSLSVTSNYDTSVLSPGLGGFGNLNTIGGNFTVASGFPVTGGATMTGVNLGTNMDFQDDMPVDFTGGIIGASMVGFLTQVGVAATKTVDHVNFMVAGAQVAAGSTGGTITSLDLYSAAGILPSAGTLVISELVGYHARSTLCATSPTACYGLKVDDSAALNYFAGEANADLGFRLSTSGAQPACAVGIRGKLWVIQGGVGVADAYQICTKDAADVYAWQAVGSGLSDYLYKPGLAGGQTASGGIAASENLILRSTTHATKGQVYLDETTTSTSPTTGALRVDGGVGVGERINAVGAIRSDTSLVVSDPGAGTNTVTLQAGVVSASYAVTLPLAQATAAQQALVNDGTGVTSWQSLTPQIFGTRQTGRTIVAGTGITSGASHMSTTVASQLIFVVGSSGGTDITASPQIEAGTIIGQEMQICGTVDADWVQLDNGAGVSLNGPAVLGKDDCITLRWLGSDGVTSDWSEKSRNF